MNKEQMDDIKAATDYFTSRITSILENTVLYEQAARVTEKHPKEILSVYVSRHTTFYGMLDQIRDAEPLLETLESVYGAVTRTENDGASLSYHVERADPDGVLQRIASLVITPTSCEKVEVGRTEVPIYELRCTDQPASEETVSGT